MAPQATGIPVNCICCNNDPVNLFVYDIGDSRTCVLLCSNHVNQKYFLKDIFEVRLLDEKLVNFYTI